MGTITNFSSHRGLSAQRPCNPATLCRCLRTLSVLLHEPGVYNAYKQSNVLGVAAEVENVRAQYRYQLMIGGLQPISTQHAARYLSYLRAGPTADSSFAAPYWSRLIPGSRYRSLAPPETELQLQCRVPRPTNHILESYLVRGNDDNGFERPRS